MLKQSSRGTCRNALSCGGINTTFGFCEEASTLSKSKKADPVKAMLVKHLIGRLRGKRRDLELAVGRWRGYVMYKRIAERAFNKVLEVNHRHSEKRFEGGCFILERVLAKGEERVRF